MQHNKTSLKFLFCGRPKTPKCFCTGLHIKKCRFETLIGRVIVFFSWARYFILKVPLSTPRSINGYCQSVSKYWGNRKGRRGGGVFWDGLPSHPWGRRNTLLLWVIESTKFCCTYGQLWFEGWLVLNLYFATNFSWYHLLYSLSKTVNGHRGGTDNMMIPPPYYQQYI